MNLDFGNNFDNADAISADKATLYQYVGINSAHTIISVGTKNDIKINVSVMYFLPFCLTFRMMFRLEYFSLILNFNFIRNYPCFSCFVYLTNMLYHISPIPYWSYVLMVFWRHFRRCSRYFPEVYIFYIWSF